MKSIGVNKIILKFISSYVVHTFLPNNTFIVKDIQGFPHVRVPYKDLISVNNMKHWI